MLTTTSSTLVDCPSAATDASGSDAALQVRITVHPRIASGATPVRVGIPLPESLGGVSPEDVELFDPCRQRGVPCDVSYDMASGWLLVTALLDLCDTTDPCELLLRKKRLGPPLNLSNPFIRAAREDQNSFSLDAGALKVRMAAGGDRLLESASWGERSLLGKRGMQLTLQTQSGRSRSFTWREAVVEEQNGISCTVLIRGACGCLQAECRLTAYAGLGLLRCEATIHNPRRAKHPDGYWDLGDPGSILLRELSLEIDTALAAPQLAWQAMPSGPVQRSCGDRLEIYQESSGGEHWKSVNHVNWEGLVPLQFRGYRVRTAEGESRGHRASPTVFLSSDSATIGCVLEEFWEKFPSAIVVGQGLIQVKFLPAEFPDLHELQAGEKCTRVMWLHFATNAESAKLAWVHDPPRMTLDTRWVAGSQRVLYMPGPTARRRRELVELLHEAIDGERNFFQKREAIDEFGWRNFGDTWADHEGKYSEDPHPVVSHYNNQYDLLHGMLVEYLRSGDARWWQLADPLARHVLDIDIYHTMRDKPAYNGGMFWHTAHYHAAGRSTHRSMSASMRGKEAPAPGTGPGNEHNYTSGLLLYYRLTGSRRAAEAVLQLADWVLAMDDGDRHLLGLVCSSPTGHATCTTEATYHGPGRGAANSIQALVNAWTLSGDRRYLEAAVDFIRRTVHPNDDLAARELGSAELRWSYTVYLQTLLRFLDETRAAKGLAGMRQYIVASILHYARWMCGHEKFYLDEPEKLQYPTETWAAQELRKGTVLLQSACYASPEEAAAFRQRGQEILDRAWSTLRGFESRVCTRPLALVLQQGYLETSFSERTEYGWLARELAETAFESPTSFLPQKEQVRRVTRSPRSMALAAVRMCSPRRIAAALKQSWLVERCRCLADGSGRLR
jgi:hypothetical protein